MVTKGGPTLDLRSGDRTGDDPINYRGANQVTLSVVAPMFNEELRIHGNVQALIAALDGSGEAWELILVNDGSTDKTLAAVRDAAGADPRVRILSYDRNYGRGYALRTGFAASRGRYVVTTESDLSWGADAVLRLFEELERGDSDVMIVSPYAPGGKLLNVPRSRAFLSRFGNRILTTAVPGNLTMISGMTRGYRREVLESLDLQSDGKEIHLEIVSKCIALGYRIREIPGTLAWEPALKGLPRRRSNFAARRLIVSHLFFSVYEKPTLLFGFVGLLLCLLGLVAGAYLLVLWRQGTLNPERPMVTLMVLLLLVGGQMFAFGFIGTQITVLRREVYRLMRGVKDLREPGDVSETTRPFDLSTTPTDET